MHPVEFGDRYVDIVEVETHVPLYLPDGLVDLRDDEDFRTSVIVITNAHSRQRETISTNFDDLLDGEDWLPIAHLEPQQLIVSPG